MPNTQTASGTKHASNSTTVNRNQNSRDIEFLHQWPQRLDPERSPDYPTRTTSGIAEGANTTLITNPDSSFTPTTSLGLNDLYRTAHISPRSANTLFDRDIHGAIGTDHLNHVGFDGQSWHTNPSPFLIFESQPSFELTGEAGVQSLTRFDHFQDPSGLHRTDWQGFDHQIQSDTQAAATSPSAKERSNQFNSSERSVPRSALKKTLERQVSTAKTQQDNQEYQAADTTAESRRASKVTFERMSSINATSPDDEESSSDERSSDRNQPEPQQPTTNVKGSGTTGARPPNTVNPQSTANTSPPQQQNVGSKSVTGHPPAILPPEKVFPIQIGSELFRLSGASISSDAPSYFTQFFEDQIKQLEELGGVRTLYIDRDPETFRDVARHLQGYYIKPRDGNHFVKLFADAQFYQLPRLIDQLFESDIYIQIGEQHFQIPKDVFTEPGNSPNFFSLGFAVFFSSPGEVFPGLDRRGLLRPPSITPPYVGGRSAKTFSQLLHLLRGYPLNIENEIHRAELLRDCRYYHLRGLEQKIIAHDISYNSAREKTEICIRIEDVKPSGISYKADDTDSTSDAGGWVQYARPFVDDTAYDLIIEMGSECTLFDLGDMRLDFHGLAKARISSLFQVVANKMNLPTKAPLGLMVLSGGSSSHSARPGNTPLSEDRVKVRFDAATDVTLDGEQFIFEPNSRMGRHLLHGSGSHSQTRGPEHDDDNNDSDSDVNTESPEHEQHGQGSYTNTATTTSRKRRRLDRSGSAALANISDQGKWIIRTGQWRLRVQSNAQDSIRGGFEIVFIAVKIDAYSNERARNARREFFTAPS